MAFLLKGVSVPHRKNTAGMSPVVMPVPETVCIPMTMHIGKSADVAVKEGDAVKVGTLIGNQSAYVSSPVYSSVSGTVKSITQIMLSDGRMGDAVVIESDGLQTEDENIIPPVVTNREELLDAISKSAVVGLGGAGFPSHVKFGADPDKIEVLIINGAECEPYITSDSVTMTQRSDDMSYTLSVLEKILGIKKIVIGIESNKKSAISKMKELASKDKCVSVKTLPSVYPQGGEKVLVYHTTGKVIKAGKLPIDVGCIVCNCTTLAAIGNYLKTGMPLVKKCVTVDGSAVSEPKNVIVPIGASMRDVFEFCGGFKKDPAKILYGGPMMGIAANSLDVPILKNTNAIIALDKKEAALPEETACIRCGACTNHCPFGINPATVSRDYELRDAKAMIEHGVDTCMLCGSCSFICPAKRPLTQTMKLSKAAAGAYRAVMKEKEGNK